MDPFHFIFHLTFPFYYNHCVLFKIICILLRGYICLTCTAEVCRLFPLVFVLYIIGLRMFHEYLDMLDKHWDVVNWLDERLTNSYLVSLTECHVHLTFIRRFQEFGTFVLMIIGLALGVIFFFATFKFYGLLPTPIYFFCPSVSIIVIVAIQLTIPSTINLHDRSTALIIKWKRQLGSTAKNRRFLKRKLASLRPTTLFVGVNGLNFFSLKRSIKSTYYNEILDHTITLLFLIPTELLESAFL